MVRYGIEDFRKAMARLVAKNPRKVYSDEELIKALPKSYNLTPEKIEDYLQAHINVEQTSPFAPDLRPTLLFMEEKKEKKTYRRQPRNVFVTGIKDPEFAMRELEQHSEFYQHEWKRTNTRVHFYDEHGRNVMTNYEHQRPK